MKWMARILGSLLSATAFEATVANAVPLLPERTTVELCDYCERGEEEVFRLWPAPAIFRAGDDFILVTRVKNPPLPYWDDAARLRSGLHITLRLRAANDEVLYHYSFPQRSYPLIERFPAPLQFIHIRTEEAWSGHNLLTVQFVESRTGRLIAERNLTLRVAK